MSTDVYLEGKRIKLDPTRSLGKGGEADVYEHDGRALKIFKTPDHPDYDGLPGEQQAAERRIALHQKKLRAFPTSLPPEVIVPQLLATDRSGGVVLGYVMQLVAGAEPLLRYGEAAFRNTAAPASVVVGVFRELWKTLRAIHGAGVVVGDFNDLNVLVTRDHHPRVIDADSFQFPGFPCAVFTERFVDPLLCDQTGSALRLTRPYEASADWYAFSALLMQSLLLVGPYGGVYRPKAQGASRVGHAERPLRRITVFHEDVCYPKPAIPYRVLPDALLHHFHCVFERDERGAFPHRLLDELAFVRCDSCKVEYAGPRCPRCADARAVSIPSAFAGGSRCRAERVFETSGTIAFACAERGELRVLYHEGDAYRREDRATILGGPLRPNLRIRIRGRQTILGENSELSVLSPGAESRRFGVDTNRTGPAFDANARHLYWVEGGRLMRDAPDVTAPRAFANGAELIGDVLANQTRIWVGPTFGLGFYRAGRFSRVFVFDAEHRGINDEMRLPPLRGEVIDAACVLDDERAWLLLAMQTGGKVEHLCFVYSRKGVAEASARAERGDESWLGSLSGKCATHGALLVATDSGIARVEVHAGGLKVARRFEDTERFVDDSCQLLVGAEGLYVVGSRQIHALRMSK